MKFGKVLLAAALVGVASTASAQFTGGSKGSAGAADTNPYNRFTISYDNVHLGANKEMGKPFMDESGMSMNGFGLEYTHGFSVSKSLPMFVEAGLKLEFAAGKVSDYDKSDEVEYAMKTNFLSFIVPVNYTYRFGIGDNMSIAPYLGINFKVHALGQFKDQITFDDPDYQDAWEEIRDEYEDDPERWINVFSDSDENMGHKDNTWNRFQMGWQIGVGFNYKAFYLGLQYGTDFIPAFKYKKAKVNTGTFALKLGVNF